MKRFVVFILVAALVVPVAAASRDDRFTDNGDGTVTDNETELMWQQTDVDTYRDWEDALAYCEGLDLAGHEDWRLPDIKELRSIVDNTTYNPAIDEDFFPGTNPSGYWSSSTSAYYTDSAWYVSFTNGYVYYYDKTDSRYARCVRQ